jgi:hypothetical protein
MPSYVSFNVVLSLCMIMAVIALLVGRSEGNRSIVNQNFPTERIRKPRSNLGDVINERGR